MKVLKISLSLVFLMTFFVVGINAQSTAKKACAKSTKSCAKACAKKSATQTSATAMNVAKADGKACTPGCCALCPPGCCEGKAKSASLVNNAKEASMKDKICNKVCPPKCCKGGAKSEAASLKVAQSTTDSDAPIVAMDGIEIAPNNPNAKVCCDKTAAKTCCKKGAKVATTKIATAQPRATQVKAETTPKKACAKSCAKKCTKKAKSNL